MKKNKWIILGILICSVWGHANPKVNDVAVSDPAYSAVKKSVESGYFTLVDGGKFLPNQPITRKELAILLDKLDTMTRASTLTPKDTLALKDFSKRFKSYLESQENDQGVLGSELSLLKTEQKSIHYDVSRLTDEVAALSKKNNEHMQYIWVGLVLAVAGILI